MRVQRLTEDIYEILIASDIHGSRYYAQKLAERFAAEGAEQLILLGDIYNHGPRNPLPKDYDPMGVASVLNALVSKLTVVKGNCDSDVDTLISDFEFVSEAVIFTEGKKVFLQHGDRFSIDKLPKNCGDALHLRPLPYGLYPQGGRRARRQLRLNVAAQRGYRAQLYGVGRQGG